MESNITIRNKLVSAIALVSVTFTFSFITFLFPSTNPTTDPHDIWFQRSGSFMVVASIWAEFILIRTGGYLDPHNEKYMVFTDMPPYLNHLHRQLSKAVIFLALYGTLVWGYGDLIIK